MPRIAHTFKSVEVGGGQYNLTKDFFLHMGKKSYSLKDPKEAEEAILLLLEKLEELTKS